MRFYMGISKRVKLKTLLKVAAAIGFLIIMTLGLDKAHAEEVWTSFYYSSDFITSISGYNLTESSNFQNTDIFLLTGNEIERNSNSSGRGYDFYIPNSNYQKKYFVSATSPNTSLGSSPPSSLNYISQELSFKFLNNNYCSNDSTDLKSFNIKFPIQYSGYMYDYSTFNQTDQSDVFGVRISAVDSTNNVHYNTTCTKEFVEYLSDYYLVTCTGVFQGNSNYTIDYFTIDVSNTVPFNDYYNSNVSGKAIAGRIILGGGNYTFYNNNIRYSMSYSCSEDQPVLDGSLPGGEDDPNGLNDIYDKIRDDYDDTIPGIDLFDIELPDSIQELISLPIYVVNNIVEHSNTCTPYQIDFSSMVNHFGNPGGTYVLTLPCMRNYLSNLLSINSYSSNSTFIPSSNNGFNLYNLIDTLLAAVVFYNIGLAIIQLIDAITSGADLYSYYYSRQSKKEGAHINHETGEVR